MPDVRQGNTAYTDFNYENLYNQYMVGLVNPTNDDEEIEKIITSGLKIESYEDPKEQTDKGPQHLLVGDHSSSNDEELSDSMKQRMNENVREKLAQLQHNRDYFCFLKTTLPLKLENKLDPSCISGIKPRIVLDRSNSSLCTHVDKSEEGGPLFLRSHFHKEHATQQKHHHNHHHHQDHHHHHHHHHRNPSHNHDDEGGGDEGYHTLHVYLDHSVIEIFVDGGRTRLSSRVYPTLKSSQHVELFAQGAHLHVSSVDIWQLASTTTTPN